MAGKAGAQEPLAQAMSEAASVGLEAAYLDAIGRAQSLLVALDEGRLPPFLLNDSALKNVYPDELAVAIIDWAHGCAPAIACLRDDTTMCAYFATEVDDESKTNFCLTVRQAEVGLRESLYERFRMDWPEY